MKALFLFCLVALCYAQNLTSSPTIKIGRTRSLVGDLSGLSPLVDPGIDIWLKIMEKENGIVLSGTRYTFEQKTYNDASGK